MELLSNILAGYDERAPLAEAATIPAPFYTDPRIADLERRTVFSRSWQMVGRADQVVKPGEYITVTVAEEPLVVVRGDDGVLRAFFNVCRHHAAAVMTEPAGCAQHLRCPYHGWTYGLDGSLKGAPEFGDVRNFDRSQNGLVPVQVATWEKFVFVNLDPAAAPLADFLGPALAGRFVPLGLASLHFVERRVFHLNCNWKVFVDNYLDGGYHVPHLHKGLNSVLEYTDYKIETEDRYCLQSSPVVAGGEQATAAVRKGYAYYFWLYPNVMFNWYEGYLDTNLALPMGIDRCQVIFDFYFADVSEKAAEYNRKSIEVSQRVQDEDHAICESVQRGLNSRAYSAGRLSVRREAGEHLFHRLLTRDLRSGLERERAAAD